MYRNNSKQALSQISNDTVQFSHQLHAQGEQNLNLCVRPKLGQGLKESELSRLI